MFNGFEGCTILPKSRKVKRVRKTHQNKKGRPSGLYAGMEQKKKEESGSVKGKERETKETYINKLGEL